MFEVYEGIIQWYDRTLWIIIDVEVNIWDNPHIQIIFLWSICGDKEDLFSTEFDLIDISVDFLTLWVGILLWICPVNHDSEPYF